MRETIFDLLEEEITPGKEGYMEVASRAPQPKDDSFINSVSDYAKTFIKGGVEGISRLGRMMGPLSDEKGKPTTQMLEEQTENLNELLPTQEGFSQKSLRRGLRSAPSMLAFPGASASQIATRTAGASIAGQTSEELGAPEWIQDAAELTAFMTPDITKKLLNSGKNKEIIEFAKKRGMTDEQITPLLQSENKKKWLSKITSKRGSTESALESTKKGIQQAYKSVLESPAAKNEISEVANGKLINSIEEKLNNVPRSKRDIVEKDLSDLLNNRITGESLMNFWKDVGSSKSSELMTLKGPISDALKSISPELEKEFKLANELYSKYHPISKLLKPNIASDIITGAEVIGGFSALGAVLMGHYAPLAGVIGEQAAKKFAQQLLINPNLQQLGKKIANALNDNKFQIATKLIKSVSNQIKKESPEVSEKLEEISEKNLAELILFSTHESEKEK